jgi:hypothetical protein
MGQLPVGSPRAGILLFDGSACMEGPDWENDENAPHHHRAVERKFDNSLGGGAITVPPG